MGKIGKLAAMVRPVWRALRDLMEAKLDAFRERRFLALTKLLAFEGGRRFPAFVREFLQESSLRPGAPSLEALGRRAQGCHTLLAQTSPALSYSILMPVYRPKPRFFECALRAALDQSAPQMEVLVGFDGKPSGELTEIVSRLRSSHARGAALRDFTFEHGGISATTNALAQRAVGTHLLFMDHDDWMRPDLLYRYEQTLRLTGAPFQTVLSCDELKIDVSDSILPGTRVHKADRPTFPYFFQNHIAHALLVPKALFDQVGGLRTVCDGAQDYDLCLRLDLGGARFENIPLPLYAWRSHPQSTASSADVKHSTSDNGLRAFTDYVAARGLAWDTEAGLLPTQYRARPRVTQIPAVHAILPFRDGGTLTQKAVASLRRQTGIDVRITAVDNGSRDLSIGRALEAEGCEVLRVDEPFNYSRLNNFAEKNSKFAADTPLVLFMNNDVELDAGALREMIGWALEAPIGAVGCRLHYPNGLLQHGGIELDRRGPAHKETWVYPEGGRPEASLGRTLVLRTCDAVTAACLLTRREVHRAVGGFDENLYPIAYSDTDYCRRIRERELFVLYTPFARGVHDESASRPRGAVEDFESSEWLNRKRLFFRGRA